MCSRYLLPENGSGFSLISKDGSVTIMVSAHWVANRFEEANNDARKSISQLFDDAVAETLQQSGTITYSIKKDEFYVISGNFGDNGYYERMTISSTCPAIYNSVRVFYPNRLDLLLNTLVTRLSKSLSATCKGEEGQLESIYCTPSDLNRAMTASLE